MPNQYPSRIWDKEQSLLGCSYCNLVKPVSSFHKDGSNKYGHSYWCKECSCKKTQEYHKKRKNDVLYAQSKRNGWIKRAHNLTLTEYTEKLIAQKSKCAICGVKLLPSGQLTHLDHNHSNGKLRDFLCTNCNRGLGHFQDSPKLLAKAKAYLELHNTDVVCVKEGTHL